MGLEDGLHGETVTPENVVGAALGEPGVTVGVPAPSVDALAM